MSTPDLSEFDAVKARRTSGPMLRLDHVLAELDPVRSAQLRAALLDSGYSRRVITDVVTGWGVALSETAVENWRRRNGVQVS
jgi:recombinational DNA repair ATPase RecF